MKTKNLLLAVVFLLLACCPVFADRELDRTEILQLFQTLTSQPDRKSTRLNSSHTDISRMPSSA